ncbi:MAG TPA: hypothetical protein VFD54_09290 [Anaerolineales bacterium]|jgi:hypothetical protein|nr:hypothetical protein [Anaerolineales bacterium]
MHTKNPNENRRLRWMALLTLIGLFGNIVTAVIAILSLGGWIEVSILSVLIGFGIFGSLSFIAKLLINREINRTDGVSHVKDFR